MPESNSDRAQRVTETLENSPQAQRVREGASQGYLGETAGAEEDHSLAAAVKRLEAEEERLRRLGKHGSQQ